MAQKNKTRPAKRDPIHPRDVKRPLGDSLEEKFARRGDFTGNDRRRTSS